MPTQAELAARLDRLTMMKHIGYLVTLISLGGCFELYDLFLTAYIAPALNRAGYSPAAIGVLITVSLAGDFCGTYAIGLFADRWGRRRTLAILALLMAATGAIFGLTVLYPILLVAAFFGTLGTSGSETAPFLPIEQATALPILPLSSYYGLLSRAPTRLSPTVLPGGGTPAVATQATEQGDAGGPPLRDVSS